MYVGVSVIAPIVSVNVLGYDQDMGFYPIYSVSSDRYFYPSELLVGNFRIALLLR